MAREMWKQLTMVKESRGQLGVLAMSQALYRATADESFEMVNHISKLQKLQEELHIMESPVLDEDFVMILITLLLQAWDNYTLAYLGSSRNKPELQSHKIIAILLDEDQRCKGQSGSMIDSALQAKEKNKHENEKDDGDKKKCYNCKKKGDIAKDCWAKGGGMEGKGPQGRRRPNRNRSNQAKEGNSSLNDLTYMATAKTLSNSKSDWYLDSSTTFHITNDWNAFMEFTATLETLVLGIGNPAMTLGYGTISIKFKVNKPTNCNTHYIF